MIDLIRDMILAAAGVLVLFVLNRANSHRATVPSRVWSFILVGFLLLLFGRILEMLEPEMLGLGILAKGLLQEVLGFCLGFLTLSIGLIMWLPTALRRAPLHDGAGRPVRSAPGAVRSVGLSGDPNAAQEMLTSVLKSSLSGVMVVTAVRDAANDIVDFRFSLVNDAAQQILGRSSVSLIGRDVLREFKCIQKENLLGHMVSVIETGLPYRNERRFIQDREGRWYEFVAVKLGDGLAVTFGDISAQKEAAEQLRHAAHHDTLTGLPNRALFTERLDQAINRTKRFSDYDFAILFLDFDRFKTINDTLGHEAGDQLLIGIADRLRSNLRGLDTPSRVEEEHLPARLGGDEFVVLLENITSVRDAVGVADRLLVELSAPHRLAGHEIVSTASIGIVSSTLGYTSADDMIRDADTAMYQAKMTGKARYVVFDERMHREVMESAKLERELRATIEGQGLELEFDPIIQLDTGDIAGFEAAVRWRHPKRGLLLASEFVDLAEEIGLSGQLDDWVIRQVCASLRTWRETGDQGPSLTVGVNLSRRQLDRPDFVSLVRDALTEHDVPAEALRLEIVETTLARDVSAVQAVFTQLHELGVQLALDDFGSGHSSLSSLHRFPIDVLKINPDLVVSGRQHRGDGAIMNAVVELAHNLDMKVVAGGVEACDQVALLQAIDCDYAQGPVFRAPATTDEVTELLSHSVRFGRAA